MNCFEYLKTQNSILIEFPTMKALAGKAEKRLQCVLKHKMTDGYDFKQDANSNNRLICLLVCIYRSLRFLKYP